MSLQLPRILPDEQASSCSGGADEADHQRSPPQPDVELLPGLPRRRHHLLVGVRSHGSPTRVRSAVHPPPEGFHGPHHGQHLPHTQLSQAHLAGLNWTFCFCCSLLTLQKFYTYVLVLKPRWIFLLTEVKPRTGGIHNEGWSGNDVCHKLAHHLVQSRFQVIVTSYLFLWLNLK